MYAYLLKYNHQIGFVPYTRTMSSILTHPNDLTCTSGFDITDVISMLKYDNIEKCFKFHEYGFEVL